MRGVLSGAETRTQERNIPSREKAFQAYFMKKIPHGYRTSLTSGGGFPDVLLIDEDKYSLAELKILDLTKAGDKKLSALFRDSQYPWYWNYLAKGGTRLFIVFKLENGYGVLKVTKEFLMEFDVVKYSDLSQFGYKEYDRLGDLIDENF